MKERILFSKKSKGTTVQVIEKSLTRHLRFGNRVKQSSMDVQHPYVLNLKYTRDMVQALSLHPNPQKVLCLGLGAGSIPSFLHFNFPWMEIDCVEYNPAVIDVAYKWFRLPQCEQLKTFEDDALTYVASCDKEYDLIFIDTYSSNKIPSHLKSDLFIQGVSDLLSSDGVAVSNIWINERTYENELNQWHRFFTNVFTRTNVPKSGNLVLFGTKADMRPEYIADVSVMNSHIKHIGSAKDITLDREFVEV